MSYLRIEYSGILEDDYASKEDAIQAFLAVLEAVDENNVTVEEWDEEEHRWENMKHNSGEASP